MTYLVVLGDGSLVPQVSESQLIIMVNCGDIYIGYFDREKFIKADFWIREVMISDELKLDIRLWLMAENADIMIKRHPVCILCPSKFKASILVDG